MNLFGDLPAPSNKSCGRSSGDDSLDVQLARIRGASSRAQAAAAEEENSEEEEEEEGDDDDEEEEEQEEQEEQQYQDLRRRPRNLSPDVPAADAEAPHAGHDTLHHADSAERTTKRVRIHEAVVTESFEPKSHANGEDGIRVAVHRIASHISNPTKFAKASPLLRKLLDGEGLTKGKHQDCIFEAVRAAFLNPENCTEPLLRREYMKLIAAVASRQDLFGKPEKAHLDIYRLVGHVQNELATDDSFVFNKGKGRESHQLCLHQFCFNEGKGREGHQSCLHQFCFNKGKGREGHQSCLHQFCFNKGRGRESHQSCVV
jgi:hypothetical protein